MYANTLNALYLSLHSLAGLEQSLDLSAAFFSSTFKHHQKKSVELEKKIVSH